MLQNITDEYSLNEFLDQIEQPLALADKDKKIIWCNSDFRDLLGNIRIKGRSFLNIFSSVSDDFENDYKNINSTSFYSDEYNTNLTIHKLSSNKKTDGYILKLSSLESSPAVPGVQLDFRDALELINGKNSIEHVLRNLLKKSISTSSANFGILVIQHEQVKDDFYIEASKNKTDEIKELKKEISSDLIFISKWLNTNKKPLLTSKAANNLGYNLTRILSSQTLLISPSFYEGKLLAITITGKFKDNFKDCETKPIEIFSELISIALNLNITKELNNALEKRILQSQKLETIGKLASGMAHDFSNLLASIFGSINLLRKRVPDSNNVTKLLDNIDNCSIRAKDLIKGLLSFGKPTQEVQELVKPNYLLAEISKVITQTFPKRISFKSNIEEDLFDILGNGTQLYQVLLNLSVNAKESIDNKGEIILEGKRITIDEDNISEHPQLNKGNYVIFSVEDSGAGISEENLQRLFDPYFSTKKKETGSGSGLGLYVSHGLVKGHNGIIEVSSTIGKGTKFEVFIPAYEPTKKAKISLSNKIILLAEDEVMLSELLSELLESNGYNVIRVSNGVEVLKVLTEEIKVDLAILDYYMPVMNGIDCIKNIRKLNFNIPIILSSGSLSPKDSPEIERLKIDEILPKPYEFEILVKTIQKLI